LSVAEPTGEDPDEPTVEDPEPSDAEFGDWLNEQLNALGNVVSDIAERMLAHGDDRVTILGMTQSAVMHGLYVAGFTDETL
jgi:hypothetical protein